MSCSKPLPFNFDVLYYLNRDQLERFSIVCRPLKNFIERYFHSKPYRVFDELEIRGGSYALNINFVQWHPNRDDYSVQQFLDGQKCSIDNPLNSYEYYSFAEMRPYLGPTVRIKEAVIYVAGDSIYNPEHIAEMESIAYLWRDGTIYIWHAHENARNDDSRISAEDFPLILNSPTILQCRILEMEHAHFSFKDYKVLYTVRVIDVDYDDDEIDPNSWLQFLEQPGVKPVVVLRDVRRESVDNVLGCILKAFSSAVSPNAFKVVFAEIDEELTEFRETNKTSGEILELKKGLPVECQEEDMHEYKNDCTLERSGI
ncbi:hypothetical protein Ddc_18991 [Ditylenchus destructor]|nr:hypothetical protein Ddc_18991 [Ditylenchus destructor]